MTINDWDEINQMKEWSDDLENISNKSERFEIGFYQWY